MTRTVYRSVSAKRHSAVPRRPASNGGGSFGSMLVKLGLASTKISASRKRR